VDEIDKLKARIAELEHQLETAQQGRDRLVDSSNVMSGPTEQFKFKFGVLGQSQSAETNSDDRKATRKAAAAIAEFLRAAPTGETNDHVTPEALGLTGPHSKRCSFCTKSQDKVKKLILGPAVKTDGPGISICDECIGLCNEILDD